VAKLAVKGPLGSGWAATVAYVSAIGTTLLMLHFMRRVATVAAAQPQQRASAGLRWPWLLTAVAAIAVPWALYLGLSLGSLYDLIAPKALWAGTWPVIVGAALAALLARVGDRLPRIAPGDVAALIDPALRGAGRAGAWMQKTDALLREWTVAGIALLTLAALFGAALLAAR
jgi:hypothetical protein